MIRCRRITILYTVLAMCAYWPAAEAGAVEPFRAELDSAFVDLISTDYPGAILRYRDILAGDSTVAEACRYLGWLQIVTGGKALDAAQRNLRRATALNPEDADAHNDLGYVYAAQHDSARALQAFRDAVRLRPNDPMFLRNLGMAALACKELRAAEAAFRSLVAKHPMDAMGFYGLGNALAGQGRGEDAFAAYRRAVGINPYLREAHEGIGQVRLRQQKLQEAAAAYEQALQIDIYSLETHRALAGIYAQLGDSLQAVRERRAVETLEVEGRYTTRVNTIFPVMPDGVAAARIQGTPFVQTGRYEDALARFAEGLALAESPGSPFRFSPALPGLLMDIGRTHQSMGNAADARRFYERVLSAWEENPLAEIAQVYLADIYLFGEGVPEQEMRGYERAVAMAPTSMAAFWVYDRLCQMHRDVGRLDACIAAYEAVRTQAPGSAGVRMRLGVAYAAAGRMEDAAAEYREAISLAENPTELQRQFEMLADRSRRKASADSTGSATETR